MIPILTHDRYLPELTYLSSPFPHKFHHPTPLTSHPPFHTTYKAPPSLTLTHSSHLTSLHLTMAKGFRQDKQWNWHNFAICLAVGFIGQLAFGYPSSIIGVTLAQPAFLEYMGLLTLVDGKPALGAHADSLIGATSGVFQAGAFFGVMIGSWVMDKYGRKAGVVYCATLSIVGGVCLCGAQNIAMFIVFRFFAGAGSWGFLALSTLFLLPLSLPLSLSACVRVCVLRLAS